MAKMHHPALQARNDELRSEILNRHEQVKQINTKPNNSREHVAHGK